MQILLNTGERRIALDLVEYVGLQNGKIDAASKHQILSILKCSGSGDRQQPQMSLFAGESERQIDGVVGAFGHNADESGIYLVARRVA